MGILPRECFDTVRPRHRFQVEQEATGGRLRGNATESRFLEEKSLFPRRPFGRFTDEQPGGLAPQEVKSLLRPIPRLRLTCCKVGSRGHVGIPWRGFSRWSRKEAGAGVAPSGCRRQRGRCERVCVILARLGWLRIRQARHRVRSEVRHSLKSKNGNDSTAPDNLLGCRPSVVEPENRRK
jgi:hypothetical protein